VAETVAVLAIDAGTIWVEERGGRLECRYAGRLPLSMAAELAAASGGPQVTVDGMPAAQWLMQAAAEGAG
jgi:hypothetical protein